MGHLAAQMEERLHGVAGHLAFPASGAGLVQRPLGDAVPQGAGLLDDRDLLVELDPAGPLHDHVAVGGLDLREMVSQ